MSLIRAASLAVSFSAMALATEAHAAAHDGSWKMVAQTTRGHCGVISVNLGVDRGRVFSTGGWFAFNPINVKGRVSPSGRVQMTAVTGPRVAEGSGRFGRNEARGTWRGKGPSGLCSGVWTANRI